MNKENSFGDVPISIKKISTIPKITRLRSQSLIFISILKKSNYKFQMFDNLPRVVSVEDNFDKLLIPKDHPSRSKSDTFYVNANPSLKDTWEFNTICNEMQLAIAKNIEAKLGLIVR